MAGEIAETRLIDCPFCESKVAGRVIAEHESFTDQDAEPFRTVLMECVVCRNSLVAGQSLFQIGPDEFGWSAPHRLWPTPDKAHDWWEIPDLVGESLEEAHKCFKARAYSACAVMCGRALEGVCAVHQTKNKLLRGGLKELLERGVIDQRLYNWGEELRRHRNLGAHATGAAISREDARDLLDFARAICDYVFVLTQKFEQFMARRAPKAATDR